MDQSGSGGSSSAGSASPARHAACLRPGVGLVRVPCSSQVRGGRLGLRSQQPRQQQQQQQQAVQAGHQVSPLCQSQQFLQSAQDDIILEGLKGHEPPYADVQEMLDAAPEWVLRQFSAGEIADMVCKNDVWDSYEELRRRLRVGKDAQLDVSG